VSVEETSALGMEQLLNRLASHAISFQRYDHAPVYTVAQANMLLPDLPGSATKNLFLRDRKGRRHFLLVCRDDLRLKLDELAELVGVSKLSLASPERLKAYLKIDPGSVSILALINDEDKQVELLIEKEIWESDSLQAHPLVNTATLVIPKKGIEKFLSLTGHYPKIIEWP
jgi:Ala-tRNA(Pro) deacylase